MSRRDLVAIIGFLIGFGFSVVLGLIAYSKVHYYSYDVGLFRVGVVGCGLLYGFITMIISIVVYLIYQKLRDRT